MSAPPSYDRRLDRCWDARGAEPRRSRALVAVLALAVGLGLGCEKPQVIGLAPECAPGAEEHCAARSDCGVCLARRRVCGATGHWGSCEAVASAGVAVRCDAHHDDDCDGVCNVEEQACLCPNHDASRCCYGGPRGTQGIGRCRGGTQDCAGWHFGACIGEELPSPIERCDNHIDDDCDGEVDEDCAAPRILAVAVGDRVSCALAREGAARSLACWGAGDSGIFGADYSNRPRPTQVAAPADTDAITMGAEHLCVRTTRGEVWCVGANDAGQLGDGTFERRSEFVRVTGMPEVVGVAAGLRHTCALDVGGQVWCWGSDRVGQLGGATAGLTRCGEGGDRGCGRSPRLVAGVIGATAIRAGFEHTCVRTVTSAHCWGRGEAFGKSGPQMPVSVFVGGRIDALVAGGHGTCRLERDGGAYRVACAGDAYRFADLLSARAYRVIDVAGGARWCALITSETVRCSDDPWGDHGPRVDAVVRTNLLAPLGFTPPGRASSLSVGLSHGCVVVEGGTVECWGDEQPMSDRGELGARRLSGPRGEPGEVGW